MAISQTVPFRVYEPNEDDFEIFIQRFNAACTANETSEHKKVVILLSLLDSGLLKLGNDLFFPEKMEAQTYELIVKKIRQHLEPKKKIIPQRCLFLKRTQRENESVSEYLRELKHLASNCAFGEMLEMMLRDRFVAGLTSESLQKRLLQEDDEAKLERVFALAVSYELAEKDAKELHEKEVARVTSHIERNRKSKYSPTKENFTSATKERTCYRCGMKNSHLAPACPQKFKTCYKCEKIGHLSNVCKAKGNAQKSGYVQQQIIFSLKGGTEVKIALTVDGQILNGIVDTGSPVTLMPKSIFEKLWRAKPLIPTAINLKSFCNNPIKVVGERKGFVKETNMLLRLIVVDEMLAHYDPAKELVLACDASSYGLGVVLSHRYKKQESPIAFASRTLTEAEKHYSQLEKEALSIVYGCEKFRQYLLGRSFVLVTDNGPLMHLFSPHKPIPLCAASRIKRCSLKLGAFHYSVEFRKTEDHGNADALSRLPLKANEGGSYDDDQILLLRKMNEVPFSFQDVAFETKRGKTLAIVLRNVQEDTWKSPKFTKKNPLSPYYKVRNELSVDFGCLQWKERIVIPPKLRSQILIDLHEMHFEIVKMKIIARRYFWWPGIDKSIEDMARQCTICQESADMPPSMITEWTWPEKPWHRLHLDLAGPFMGRMFLVIVDAYTKWLKIFILRDIASKTIVDCLRQVFGRFGLPEFLVTDNGRQFVSREMEEFTRMNGIRHTKTSPYNPSTNGAFPQSVLKESPAELLMKRRLKSRFSNLMPKMDMKGEGFPDALRKQEHFKIGSDVYFRNYAAGPKWKIGTILKLLSCRHYLIGYEGQSLKRHINQLRPVKGNPEATVEKEPSLVLPSTSGQGLRRESHCEREPSHSGLEIPEEEFTTNELEPQSTRQELTSRQLSRMCGTSLKTINSIIHKDLELDTRRKGKVHKLTPFHMKNRATNARKLYEEHLAGSRSEYTATLDEAWMSRIIGFTKCSETFPKGFMVVGVMTGRGVLPLIKVPSKVKVNSEFYIECVLKPVIEQLKDLYPGEMDKVFLHHDKASSHTSNKTQQFLQEMKDTLGLNFIRNSDIPVKSPDASPLDFYGFGMLKQRLFNRRPKTEAGLWKAAQEEWSNVSLSKVKEGEVGTSKSTIEETYLAIQAVSQHPSDKMATSKPLGALQQNYVDEVILNSEDQRLISLLWLKLGLQGSHMHPLWA
ncbi:K02A2.6-like [Cordylochernes scorpioides]|uniref:RNA-directed DNA polymerase n=1 Tax=Cordylochernes scorpioides TaxID=51811 RepID=A0ABY6KY66_9ARAC|nr:K02A2.6-like [Cordylochernes scorpioides]